MLNQNSKKILLQTVLMSFVICALGVTSSAETKSKNDGKINFLDLHAEISLQEKKLCGVKEVNDKARMILGPAESLFLNPHLNLTVVKMHTYHCVSLAFAISQGRVPRISQPTIKKVMDEFCTYADSWSFPEDGNSCNESKYYE